VVAVAIVPLGNLGLQTPNANQELRAIAGIDAQAAQVHVGKFKQIGTLRTRNEKPMQLGDRGKR
jgi:hypothetical protein